MTTRTITWLLVPVLAAAVLAKDAKPPAKPEVSIRIVDSESGAPVTKFRYQYQVNVPGIQNGRELSEWKYHEAPDGVLTLPGRAPCQVEIGIEAREYQTGFWDTYHKVGVVTNDGDGMPVVKLRRGTVATGRVIDEQTQQPIRGAEVAPDVFTPPTQNTAWHRKVYTDEAGNFTLAGIDPLSGVSVRHSEYVGSGFGVAKEFLEGKKSVVNVVVGLARAEVYTGIVSSPDGRPLEGVEIADEYDRFDKSDRNGRFSVVGSFKSPCDSYKFRFRKKGFIDVDLAPPQDAATKFNATMEPVCELRGRVLSPGGALIRQYTTITGPGRAPPRHRCTQQNIQAEDGTFVFTSEEPGKHWVCVRAAGFALWEGWFEFQRTQPAPVEIVLSPGATVSGKVEWPKNGASPAEIVLRPTSTEPEKLPGIVSEPAPLGSFGEIRATIQPDGSYRVPNVRPDHYQMVIEGPRVSPRVREIDVSAAGLEMPLIRLVGTGRLKGKVCKPARDGGGSWAFANVGLSWARDRRVAPKYVRIMADENGCFEVSDVAVGVVEVSVTCMMTADIYTTTSDPAFVFTNQTAEVKIITSSQPR